ncbi:hypothetical protein PF010_g15130 [Phytophthora fragariae]|uniref:Uncharacterized protein n=1 Tax=Phytophthora fragariae TaxID=53985 RepID=A0A6G0KVR5_9STRA|nr:hypothetical protein PF010_g15130 [Phytophthora fragariae]
MPPCGISVCAASPCHFLPAPATACCLAVPLTPERLFPSGVFLRVFTATACCLAVPLTPERLFPSGVFLRVFTATKYLTDVTVLIKPENSFLSFTEQDLSMAGGCTNCTSSCCSNSRYSRRLRSRLPPPPLFCTGGEASDGISVRLQPIERRSSRTRRVARPRRCFMSKWHRRLRSHLQPRDRFN